MNTSPDSLLHPLVENTFLWFAESAIAGWPRASPSADQLARTTIVAHRGERDGVRVKENTLAAFDPAVEAGVGAIEFDIRYTRDDEPVISHDADLRRVFGRRERIDELTWRALASRVPEIPHLADLIDRYRDRTHLMIELKTRGSARAEQRLADRLAELTPARDFHILSLVPALFGALPDLPSQACIPVAKANWASTRDWSLAHACGGVAGFFGLIRRDDIEHAEAANRLIGSGFINRRGVLMREIGRNIPWIFTNRPLTLQRFLDRARGRAAKTVRNVKDDWL